MNELKIDTSIDWRRLLPRYWLQNEPTDRYWDAAINLALDSTLPIVGRLTFTVGKTEVWIGNWPYAYGSQCRASSGLPTVKTRLRIRAAVGSAMAQQMLAEIESKT